MAAPSRAPSAAGAADSGRPGHLLRAEMSVRCRLYVHVVDGFECKLGVIDQASDLSAQGASSGISQTKMGRNASHVMSIHQLIVGMVTRDSTGATQA